MNVDFTKGLCRTSVVIAVLIAAGPAFSVNWEGHEDFFMEQMAVPDFTSNVPKPLQRPLPWCQERLKNVTTNRYEQVPIPGKNCKAQLPEPPALKPTEKSPPR